MKTVTGGFDIDASLRFVIVNGDDKTRFYEDGSQHTLTPGSVWNRGFCDTPVAEGCENDYSSWPDEKRSAVKSEWAAKRAKAK